MSNDYSSTTTASPGVLFGMGNPLLDISAPVSNETLDKYGLKANDQILCDPAKHLADGADLYKELADNKQVQFLPGGATMNTIRAAQWTMKNSANCEGATSYTGSVGQDDYRRELERCASKAGVNAHFYTNEAGESTGACACLITENGKNRSLVANLAAANKYSVDAIKAKEAQDLVNKAQYYYSAGFFLTTDGGPTAISEVAAHASANNKTFCLNLSAPFLPPFFKDQLNNAISLADIVFGNEAEMEAWGDANGVDFKDGDSKDLIKIVEALAKFPRHECKSKQNRPRLVVMTQGTDDTIVCRGDDLKINRYPVELIPKEQIVDTNGAGDAFVAGFLVGLIYGKSVEECVKIGGFTAKEIIKQPGCTFPESHDQKF